MRNTRNVLTISRFCAISKRVPSCLAALIFCSAVALGQTDEFQANSSAGPNGVIVHSQFGGQIFGFDIDQNGTEGLLAEAKQLPNGIVLAAVETFDQSTGRILNVVALTQPSHSQDDFITMGVVGNSVGLFEHEHVGQLYVNTRTFSVVNPLSSNRITGVWTPPIGAQHIIMPTGVSPARESRTSPYSPTTTADSSFPMYSAPTLPPIRSVPSS